MITRSITRKAVAASVLSSVTFLGLSATASADEASYLNAVGSTPFQANYVVGPYPPDVLLAYGTVICGNLHNGWPADNLPVTWGLPGGPIDAYMISSAQHELCPDTLTLVPWRAPGMPSPTP